MGRYYFSDNLPVLQKLFDQGERFQLVYVDPPYQTGRDFYTKKKDIAYSDVWGDTAEYWGFLRDRLLLMRLVLLETGVCVVHIDMKNVFRMKAQLDEIFGEENFLNMVSRKKCHSKNYTKKNLGSVCDYLLFYRKTSSYLWQSVYEESTEEEISALYPCVDAQGERYAKVPILASGSRNGVTGGVWRGFLPPQGKHWMYKPETLDEMDEAGKIFWGKHGNPRKKIYAQDYSGRRLTNLWVDCIDGGNQFSNTSGYPTEKNSLLLERVVLSCTQQGDAVLDPFVGSGSFLRASEKHNRVWVGIDNSSESKKCVLGDFPKVEVIL